MVEGQDIRQVPRERLDARVEVGVPPAAGAGERVRKIYQPDRDCRRLCIVRRALQGVASSLRPCCSGLRQVVVLQLVVQNELERGASWMRTYSPRNAGGGAAECPRKTHQRRTS